MAIDNLNIIGERINPGFKSTLALFDNEDITGIQELAKAQAEKGAVALNINVGERALNDADFMVEVMQAVQAVVNVPLSLDFPNVEVQEACLKAYDPEKSGGQLPIVNSISELRWEMLDLYKICPFKLIVMASERLESGERVPNKTAEDVHQTANRVTKRILTSGYGFTIDDLLVDVSVGPVAADLEGLTKMAVDSIGLIGADPELKGIHISVGLSNMSIMLPTKAVDGSPLKSQIESAFLTMTIPKGLNHIIGTPGRNYRMLPEDNMVLQGMKDAIELGGFDSVMRIQELYTGN